MSTVFNPCRGHKRRLSLVETAMNEEPNVMRTQGGHLIFSKPGLPGHYTCRTSGNHRAGMHVATSLRKAHEHHGGADG